jgi:hypothetical protein
VRSALGPGRVKTFELVILDLCTICESELGATSKVGDQVERDLTVIDRPTRLYPAWEEIIVSVLTAVETRPIRPPALHS